MSTNSKKSVVIIGGGPSAMMLACTLDPSLFKVTLIEKEKTIGRKFLVAGKGGFNLTHSEDTSQLIGKYEGGKYLLNSINHFTNDALRQWLSKIGIDTYVGSSKRVFPIKGIKPIEVLQAIQKEMDRRRVTVLTETKWSGSFIKEGSIQLSQNDKQINITADKVVFAMGGGSWKVTGSDGEWKSHFIDKGIATLPFRASNCAMHVAWQEIIQVHFGKPIKNISLSYNGRTIKGELMITEHGIEGSPAYALSYYVGEKLKQVDTTTVYIDLKPTLSIDTIIDILKAKKKISAALKSELALSAAAIALIKSITNKAEFNNFKILAKKIKELPLEVIRLGEIDEAISTVGGVSSDAINDQMGLIDFPNHYVIGEMADWNAPTGGYLLQGCFSMGRRLGAFFNEERFLDT